MYYRKTLIMNFLIFICWVLLISAGIYSSWNSLQFYEFSFLSVVVLSLYLTVIFTPAISALALLKLINQKLLLSALVLNCILFIGISCSFFYFQTLPHNMVRKVYEPLIMVLFLVSALPAAINIGCLMKLKKGNE